MARKIIIYLCVIFCLFLIVSNRAIALNVNSTFPLQTRIAQFPHWDSKPPVNSSKGDLEYPEWMAGTWSVTSTLVEQFAPLAPKIITPGFEENQQYLERGIEFKVKFVSPTSVPSTHPAIVADRAFNGLEIARSYLGDRFILSVKTDPQNPNKQITSMVGNRQLISQVTGRKTEYPRPDTFIGTEVTQQIFNQPPRIYLNEVETTTAYTLRQPGHVSAEQITAIYLSPQDPDYFTALNHPVALYHYHLELHRENL